MGLCDFPTLPPPAGYGCFYQILNPSAGKQPIKRSARLYLYGLALHTGRRPALCCCLLFFSSTAFVSVTHSQLPPPVFLILKPLTLTTPYCQHLPSVLNTRTTTSLLKLCVLYFFFQQVTLKYLVSITLVLSFKPVLCLCKCMCWPTHLSTCRCAGQAQQYNQYNQNYPEEEEETINTGGSCVPLKEENN